MKIDKTNYEIWMIDYFDGKLNADEIDTLMAFLEENQDIKSEFENFENVTIEAEQIRLTSKNELKKPAFTATKNISEDNYEDYFIAFHENDLDENGYKEVFEFVDANPALKSEFGFHSALFVKAQKNLVFADKESLKKKLVFPLYWRIASAAAAILLLFGLSQFIHFENSTVKRTTGTQLSLNKIESQSFVFELSKSTEFKLIEKPVNNVGFSIPVDNIPRDQQLAFAPVSPITTDILLSNPYDYVRLIKPELQYYDINYALAESSVKNRKSAFGRIIQNLARRLTGNSQEKITGDEDTNEEPLFVKALGKSLDVFNTLTGTDTELVKNYDNEGRLTGYSVEGETIALHREINKPSTKE